MKDEWTAALPDGRTVNYKSKQLLSGRFRISAEIIGTDKDFSRIVDYPVKRAEVETVCLSELM